MSYKKGRLVLFPKAITKEQLMGTGMAMVLILLFVGVSMNNFLYIKIAIPVMLLNMILPDVFYPIAVIWLGFSNILGLFMPKVILTILFITLVVPIGFIRKILGYDSMRLKEWKMNTQSVFKDRDHTFSSSDLENPY